MSALGKMFLKAGVVLAFFALITTVKVQAQGRNVSFQVFYDELSYHGDWVNNRDYGYVWRPNVGADFRPYYTNGRWVMTQYGNTWVSDYSWGWAPFHYGRWFYDSYDGWLWVPGNEWGPAWVDWRSGGGYYGWAPMGPMLSININVGRRYYPDFYWVFIPQRYIYYNSYTPYWRPSHNVTIINHTTIINNVYVNNNVRYVSGPSVRDVRQNADRNVRVHRIEDVARPGSAIVERNAVRVYRPEIDRSTDARPSRVAVSRDEGRTDNRNTSATRPSRNEDGINRTERSQPVERERTVIGDRGGRPDRNDAGNRTSTSREERPYTAERPSRNENTVGRDREVNREARPQSVDRLRSERPAVERQPVRQPMERPQREERTQQVPQRMERPVEAPSVNRNSGAERGSGRSSAPSSRPERPSR
ncbi:DUF6600 domain-containing protein [Pseudopedobacter beijingensis]|uniref:DUF6600 domain-containing protein n=1 Tax=Pseudopedobacter beijingensis TaxID=1207056 RepID=A0ABW4IB89_9SPHI